MSRHPVWPRRSCRCEDESPTHHPGQQYLPRQNEPDGPAAEWWPIHPGETQACPVGRLRHGNSNPHWAVARGSLRDLPPGCLQGLKSSGSPSGCGGGADSWQQRQISTLPDDLIRILPPRARSRIVGEWLHGHLSIADRPPAGRVARCSSGGDRFVMNCLRSHSFTQHNVEGVGDESLQCAEDPVCRRPPGSF